VRPAFGGAGFASQTHAKPGMMQMRSRLQQGEAEVELRLASSERRAVRFTWISPARTMYLFANRQGQRALALPRLDLARKFNTGEALLVDDEPLMDRLIADVLDDYNPSQRA